jgi:hypothetical protein
MRRNDAGNIERNRCAGLPSFRHRGAGSQYSPGADNAALQRVGKSNRHSAQNCAQ